MISAISPEKSANGPSLHPDALADLVLELRLAARLLVGGAALRRQEVAHVGPRQRRGLLTLTALADESGDARGVADAVPRLVVHPAPDEQVAGEHLALHGLLAAVAELVDLLGGDDHLEDLVLHVHRLDARLEVGRDLLLVARLGVHDEPLARAGPGVVDVVGVVGLASPSAPLVGVGLGVGRRSRRRARRRSTRCRRLGLGSSTASRRRRPPRPRPSPRRRVARPRQGLTVGRLVGSVASPSSASTSWSPVGRIVGEGGRLVVGVGGGLLFGHGGITHPYSHPERMPNR